MRQGNINLGFLYANSRKEFGIPNFKRISPPQSMSLPILSLYFPTNAAPDTNASAPRYECVWGLIRMRLLPDADVTRPAFAKKYRRRNKQKYLKAPVYRASYEKSKYKHFQKLPTRPFLQSVYQ